MITFMWEVEKQIYKLWLNNGWFASLEVYDSVDILEPWQKM